MAELEIHHESEHKIDAMGQRIGVLAALLAVGLALVTIASHRAHTDSIVVQAKANDKWQYYQSRRIKFHNLELGEDLLSSIGKENTPLIQRYRTEKERYEKQGEKAQEEAHALEEESERIERRALRYDFGEGLLEIALVLTSLYFISRKLLFPGVGLAAGLLGAGIAITGLMI